MATDKIFDLEVFSVDEDGKAVAAGGFKSTTGESSFDDVVITSVLSCQSDMAADGEFTANAGVVFLGLPTSDPGDNGRLWNNSGVLTVSAG